MSSPLDGDELRIDDLGFTELLRIALADVPAAAQGRWTLHGPVDPGITLLELFAWQLEQRLFMAEQVTDPTVRASLALLGVPEPAATRAARTVLCLTGPAPGVAAAPVDVPAGTVFTLDGDPRGRRFGTEQAVAVLPVGAFTVTGRMHTPGDTLELAHDYAGPRIAGGRLSLLVDVTAAPGVAPAWSPDAHDVSPAGMLRWTAVGPDGSEAVVAVADGTGGLRRAGLLGVDWPAPWNALGAGPCRLRATLVRGRFTEPVRVRGVHANAVPAAHRVAGVADLGPQLAALLPLPGGRLRLPGTAGQLLDGPDDVRLTLVEQDERPHAWTSVAAWTAIGPQDRVFLADRARGVLVFGDGRAGRIPRPGPTGSAAYGVGGGEAGNLGPGGFWVRADGPETAVNPVPATGGREAETVADARRRAADDRAQADRTVTLADVAELTMGTPGVGVQRAHSELGLHPDFPCVPVPSAVSVVVVPFAARDGEVTSWTPDPQPDAGTLAAVRARLAGRRLAAQEVFVLPPVYRRVAMTLRVTRSARSPVLEQRVRAALGRHLDPLEGGADGSGWPFGGPVRLSALIGLVADELGPESTVSGLTVALDGGAASACDDLAIAPHELVCLDSVRVEWVLAEPTGGGLR